MLENRRSRVKEVMLASAVSYRGFYLSLDRPKEAGVVKMSEDDTDRRARIIELAVGD